MATVLRHPEHATKSKMLDDLEAMVIHNIGRQEISGREPIRLNCVEPGRMARKIPSYLVGILCLNGGLDAGRLERVLSKNDHALLRQLLPPGWTMPHGQAPDLYWDNNLLCISVPWPERLQSNSLALDRLPQSSVADGRRWIVGADTYGELVTLSFGSEKTEPHVVHHLAIGGSSGYGKSTLARSIALQVSRLPRVQIALIDGKGGESLGPVNGVRGQVGPLAGDLDRARAALYYATRQTMERNAQLSGPIGSRPTFPPLVILFSEFDAWTGGGSADPALVWMLKYVARRGRSANVHLVLDSQAFSVSDLGESSTKRQFDAVVFRTGDEYDTQALLPGRKLKPHVTLTKPGDAYVTVGPIQRRVLVAMPGAGMMAELSGGQPQMEEWPPFDAEGLEGYDDPEGPGRPTKDLDLEQLALAAVAHQRGWSRDETWRQHKDRLGRGIGKSRVSHQLLPAGEELARALERLGYCSRQPPEIDLCVDD